MIVGGIFDLAYYVSLLIRCSSARRFGYLDLAMRIFGYLKKYPKRGYTINPQPLTINVTYEKVQMKYYFVNQYLYFSEDINEHSTEPTLDELYIHVLVYDDHRKEKFAGILINGLFLVVG